MSGIEVVGIVLGSLPLVISALEHYRDGVSTVQRWRKYKREVQSLIRNLKVEKSRFENLCEKLLVDLVSMSSIEAMVKEPFGDLWKSKDVQKKIQVRLWKDYDVFEETIREVSAALEEMGERIGSQGGGKLTSEIKRARFTFSRSQYADLMTTIQENISSLENLSDTNMALEPKRRVRSQGRFFLLLRDISRGLYQALRSSLDCTCGHDVSLRLEYRSADFLPTDDDDTVVNDTTFMLGIEYAEKRTEKIYEAENQEKRIWEELRAKFVQSRQPQSMLESRFDSRPLISSVKDKKSVRFGSSSRVVENSTTMVEAPTSEADTAVKLSISQLGANMASMTLPALRENLRLCDRVTWATKRLQSVALGTIADATSPKVREYTLHPVDHSECQPSCHWSLVSLRDVLEQKTQSLYLPYQDRFHIAVVIASSMLQLYGTPWLPSILTSSHVFFITQESFPIYSYPMVIPGAAANGKAAYEDNRPSPLNFNKSLLSLGLLLTELIMGHTMESIRGPLKDTSDTSELLANYIAAQKILDQRKIPSSNYETAIKRCFGQLQKTRKLDTEEFCQEFYSGVVALLEKDMENS